MCESHLVSGTVSDTQKLTSVQWKWILGTVNDPSPQNDDIMEGETIKKKIKKSKISYEAQKNNSKSTNKT